MLHQQSLTHPPPNLPFEGGKSKNLLGRKKSTSYEAGNSDDDDE
jgi:hypothetical protein